MIRTLLQSLATAVLAVAVGFTVPSVGMAQKHGGEGHHMRQQARWSRAPYIGGVWFMWGDEDKPCRIYQERGSNRALFINEHGSRAWGSIHGDHLWIPAWGPGGRGQEGLIRGDQIIWLPDGSYWSR
jgi:hypothetical protein